MTWLEAVVAVLAVWRITHLLVHEDGPGGAVVRLRGVSARLFQHSPLDCFLCASVWVAIVPAWVAGDGLTERLLLIPALSGAAILLQRRREPVGHHDPALWTEDPHPEPPDGPLLHAGDAR